jgi:hypothetical protein
MTIFVEFAYLKIRFGDFGMELGYLLVELYFLEIVFGLFTLYLRISIVVKVLSLDPNPVDIFSNSFQLLLIHRRIPKNFNLG